MQKLKDAIAYQGWSISETARKTGIAEQSIRNLVREGETRQTNPSQITAFTMIRLIETFDTLDIEDFIPGTVLCTGWKVGHIF